MNHDQLVEYINNHQFAVIATQGNEFPESACIEFGNDGLTLIFDTNKKSRKYANIIKNSNVSLVVGFDGEENSTVQYEGIATLLEEGDELNKLQQAYFAQSPEAQKWQDQEGMVYFKVEPVWIRFTDLNQDPWDITVFEI